MSFALWHWHIEVSSKCTLKCPRCARSEVPNTLINTELDLNFFKKNFTDFTVYCTSSADNIYKSELKTQYIYFEIFFSYILCNFNKN